MHTGGIFGFIDGTMTEEIKNTNPVIDLDTIIDYISLKECPNN